MPPTRRSRAEIVAANDQSIRDAVSAMSLEVGWDAITFTGIAHRAGLTVGAVYGRAESPAELGIDLWSNSLGPFLEASLTGLHAAAVSGSGRQLLQEFRRWDADERGPLAVELLIAALFDDDLGEVVRADAEAILKPACHPDRHAVTPEQAAAGVLLFSFAFGRAIAHRAGAELPSLSRATCQVLADQQSAPPVTGRAPRAPALRWEQALDSADPQVQAVISATLDVVGRVGYRRATIARIARTARVPRGSVMTRYEDKATLVAESARLGLVPPRDVWAQYTHVVAARGPGLSRAIFLRDFLKPANRKFWALNLELARMSRFVDQLRDFCPGGSVLEQTHLGVMLTASLVADVDSLPYSGPFSAGAAT